MAYTSPKTYSAGAVLTAAEKNTYERDNMIAVKALVDAQREYPCHGRLTLTSGTPVTTADVTAATTLYFALYAGNHIGLYSGSEWSVVTFAELSIAVPATTSQMYDVFVYSNSGTATLELTAWTNDTTRATALTKQDGVYVKTGATTRRYVGSFRTTGVSGQTEDSFAKRYVWNYYNRVPRTMRVLEATDTWTYTTATVRQARATATNQLDFVVGVAEVELTAQIAVAAANDTAGGGVAVTVCVGIDTTSACTSGNLMPRVMSGVAGRTFGAWASFKSYPAVGRHFASWNEWSEAAGTTTWTGDDGAPTVFQAGIHGTLSGG